MKESCTAPRQLHNPKPADQGSWQCLHVFVRLCSLYVSSPSYYSRQRHVLPLLPSNTTSHAPLYPVIRKRMERPGLGLAYGPSRRAAGERCLVHL
jgi:hypothetical protein